MSLLQRLFSTTSAAKNDNAADPAPHLLPDSQYHAGEVAVQTVVGVRRNAEGLEGMVQPRIDGEANLRFLRSLNLVAAGIENATGDAAATPLTVALLFGEAGFVDPDPRGTAIAFDHAKLLPESVTALAASLNGAATGSRVGLLGIDLPRRRRYRINGVFTASSDATLLRVTQAMGNCPKYISGHEAVVPRGAAAGAAKTTGDAIGETLPSLTQEARELIADADTFFIATRHASGIDLNHKGGPPGFLSVLADGAVLSFPDYAGNNMFSTLGNIHLDPAVGLAIVVWKHRRVVHVSGDATLRLNVADGDQYSAGSGRFVDIAVRSVRVAALPAAVETRFHGLHPMVENIGLLANGEKFPAGAK